eukprot:CAMPEP_0195285292 /NCGR_PEP_ID=MMETSP0707-20130614/3180_1 /TAXON_ID=33640 /ORGANISM="Asterionellopsis glacialis, Strain CCMP134" /LENGTH=447 /DNA_ID=CAMNT_0040344765 /DNA_START=216 /DNA_END=1559 /DNA_ORIENTATION=+
MRAVSTSILRFGFLWTITSSSWLSSCYALSSNPNTFTTTTTTTTTSSSSTSPRGVVKQPQQPQQQTVRDEEFHEWCHSVAGIQIHPSVELQTTVKSVAGRGVFTNDNLEEGDVVLVIPEPCVMHEQNAAFYFPHVAHHLKQQRPLAIQSLATNIMEEEEEEDIITSDKSWWTRPFQRLIQQVKQRRQQQRQRRTQQSHDNIRTTSQNEKNDLEIDSSDCIWQAELTSYAMACMMEEEDPHPWKFWISQWQRDDIVYNLFQNNVQWNDEDCITHAAQQLNDQLQGDDTTYYKIRAALQLRLKRFQDLQENYPKLRQPPPQPTTPLGGGRDDNDNKDHQDNPPPSFVVSPSSMYAILCSRAIDLGDGITGVLPMFDMINHSFQPNLALMFDGENFELFATRSIEAGEELFLCYTPHYQPSSSSSSSSSWDEDEAVWCLVQWGIPNPKPS